MGDVREVTSFFLQRLSLHRHRANSRRVPCGRIALAAANVALVVLLAACATPTKPLTPDAASQLHKIALLEVPEPQQYGAANLYLEGIFGGGLVNMQHSEQFTKVLRQSGFSISNDMANELVSALTAAGFEVVRIQATRKGFTVVSHSDVSVDAILNVIVGAGYVSIHGVDDYIPSVGVPFSDFRVS
jgi:hypothetical protein